MDQFNRITFDPNLMGGRACIRGMRVTVSLILNLVANGMTARQIIKEYPYLEKEDIHQALQYAAWLADESIQILEPSHTKSVIQEKNKTVRKKSLLASLSAIEIKGPKDFLNAQTSK